MRSTTFLSSILIAAAGIASAAPIAMDQSPALLAWTPDNKLHFTVYEGIGKHNYQYTIPAPASGETTTIDDKGTVNYILNGSSLKCDFEDVDGKTTTLVSGGARYITPPKQMKSVTCA